MVQFGSESVEMWRTAPHGDRSILKLCFCRNHLLVQYPRNEHPVSLADIKHNVLTMFEPAQAAMDRITCSP